MHVQSSETLSHYNCTSFDICILYFVHQGNDSHAFHSREDDLDAFVRVQYI